MWELNKTVQKLVWNVYPRMKQMMKVPRGSIGSIFCSFPLKTGLGRGYLWLEFSEAWNSSYSGKNNLLYSMYMFKEPKLKNSINCWGKSNKKKKLFSSINHFGRVNFLELHWMLTLQSSWIYLRRPHLFSNAYSCL